MGAEIKANDTKTGLKIDRSRSVTISKRQYKNEYTYYYSDEIRFLFSGSHFRQMMILEIN